MVFDARYLGHSVREYTVVGMVIDDILKKIVDLISVVVSSRLRMGKRL